MARRRGRKGKGRRGSKAIPLLPTIVGMYPMYTAYKDYGFTKELPVAIVYRYTGYHMNAKTWSSEPVFPLLGGMIAAVVGHKIASKVGINSKLKKLSGGYLTL